MISLETDLAECNAIRECAQDQRDRLLGMLECMITEVRKYHGTFDANLFVQAERLVARIKSENAT